jgi:hypothetical protein
MTGALRLASPRGYYYRQKTDIVGGEGLDTRAKITGTEIMIDVPYPATEWIMQSSESEFRTCQLQKFIIK